MTYSKQRLREVIALKRAAVRRIQNGIGEFTVSSGGKYIRDFNREFQTFQAICQADVILEQASDANLVWIGDYHALSRGQNYAAQFVRELAGRNLNLALAVEPVFARSQNVLERWMSGLGLVADSAGRQSVA